MLRIRRLDIYPLSIGYVDDQAYMDSMKERGWRINQGAVQL